METQQNTTRSNGADPQPRDGKGPGNKVLVLIIVSVLLLAGVVFSVNAIRDEPEREGASTSIVPSSPDPITPVTLMGPPGRYAFATSFDGSIDVPYDISFEIPAGYDPAFDLAAFKKGMNETGVSVLAIGDVYADACSWAGAEVEGISSTQDVVEALASQRGVEVSTPTEVTMGGIEATYMERKVPVATNASDCDEGEFRVYTGLDGGPGGRYINNPGQLDLLWVLDLAGVPVVIDASLEAGISASDRAEVERIVQSVHIDPHEV
jgi:hypothetical protein